MFFTLQDDNARNEILSILGSCCPVLENHQLLLLTLVRGRACPKRELLAEPWGSRYSVRGTSYNTCVSRECSINSCCSSLSLL